jgi:excisionase family DNA binding protein
MSFRFFLFGVLKVSEASIRAAIECQPPLTVADAAAWLNVSAGTIYGLCAAGKLAHSRIGLGRGTIRIKREALDALLREGQKKAVDRPRLTLNDLRLAL